MKILYTCRHYAGFLEGDLEGDEGNGHSQHCPGIAPVFSETNEDLQLVRGQLPTSALLPLGNGQSARLGGGVTALTQLELSKQLRTSEPGRSDRFKSVYRECMNGFVPGIAIYTASRHQLKEDLTENKLQQLMDKYKTYYDVDWEIPQLKKHKQIPQFKSLLYPREIRHR